MPDTRSTWGLPVSTESIPQTLRAMEGVWVLWDAIEKPNGGMDKVPMLPSGHKARINQITCSFDEVKAAYETGRFSGIGLRMTDALVAAGLYLMALDLDHVLDEHGHITDVRVARLVPVSPPHPSS